MKKNQEFYRGCLVGGAIGDALGWPVEFMTKDEIDRQYGRDGIQELQITSSGKAEITDDTQMTLFTAEGIIRAEARSSLKGIPSSPPDVVFFAYQRWLLTQSGTKVDEYEWIYDGWLLNVKELYARRAPGNTCISALESREKGSVEAHINNSKGCGGVMRVAPAGLFYRKEGAFNMAAGFAALTHGHPSGFLSAGAHANIIASLIEGQDLETAVIEAINVLKTHEGHEECTMGLNKAIELSKRGISEIEAIKLLGEGWVGEEALAISVYCSLKHQQNFKKALLTSVNHDGDSDSTGAITGNILGAYLGISQIPEDWLKSIELKDVILQAADDLLTGYKDTEEWWKRYPGY